MCVNSLPMLDANGVVEFYLRVQGAQAVSAIKEEISCGSGVVATFEFHHARASRTAGPSR